MSPTLRARRSPNSDFGPDCQSEPVRETVEAGKETEVSYYVERTAFTGGSVTVVGRRPKKEVVRRTISIQEVRTISGTQGDALKVVQNLPGAAKAENWIADAHLVDCVFCCFIAFLAKERCRFWKPVPLFQFLECGLRLPAEFPRRIQPSVSADQIATGRVDDGLFL